MTYLATRQFWIGALERAVRVFAYVLAVALGVPAGGEVVGVDVRSIGWLDALSLAAGAAILSLVGSVAAGKIGVGPPGSPSLVDDRPAGDRQPVRMRLPSP